MERLFRIEDILEYIEAQQSKNTSLTRQLSMYYEATQKALEVNNKSLLLWRGYVRLLEENGYTETEIREVYKMLKGRYWKLKEFWALWYTYESKSAESRHRRQKVLDAAREMLQYKECAEKQEILKWCSNPEKTSDQGRDTEKQSTFFLHPSTPSQTRDRTSRPLSEPFSSCDLENDPGKNQNTLAIFDMPLKKAPESTLGDTGPLGASHQEEPADKSAAQGYKKITLNGKRLRILRSIGKGGSARVYQVLSEKNEVFALKKIKIHPGQENEEVYKSYVNEIELLKRLQQRTEIVTLKDSYVNKDRIAILMEYGDIDLCKFLEIERSHVPEGYRKSREVHTLLSLWEQMLRAVKCIHEHRIVHRDLKPANFLFVNGRLKLIDFGISKEIKNDTTNIIREKQIGTVNYMSPEAIIEGKTKMGRSSDIWSLGCILYEMYFGEPPFFRFKNLVQRMQKLLDPEYRVEYPAREADDVRYPEIVGAIEQCLRRDPATRARIDALLSQSIMSGRPECPEKACFTKQELQAFAKKIMEMKHTASSDARDKIAEKIADYYFARKI